MGAESSSLSEVGDDCLWSTDYFNLHSAHLIDGLTVSAFIYKPSTQSTYLINNAVKNLRVLRHPSILHFLELVETPEGRLIITEEVQPLCLVINKLTSLEIIAGLCEIIHALSFLHEAGSLSHNNVCLSSIFITPSGEWKLGGLEHVCSFKNATPDVLTKYKALRNQDALSPEEKVVHAASENGTYTLVEGTSYGHVRDAFAIGVLFCELMEQLTDMGHDCCGFEEIVQTELLCEDFKGRATMKSLTEQSLFQNEYIHIVSFLKEIILKTEDEKEEFFSDLTEKLYNIPPEAVSRRLTKLLLSRFVLLTDSAVHKLVPNLLTPYKDSVGRPDFDAVPGHVNPILPDSQFTEHIMPELKRIFHVRDLYIRTVLLTSFEAYVRLFDKSTLQNVILPQVLLGLRDTDDRLVALTLKAIACIVPITGGDVVIGPNRSKMFTKGTPKLKTYHKKSSGIFTKKPIKNGSKLSPSRTIIKNSATIIENEAARMQRREELKKRAGERKAKREQRMKLKRINDPMILSEDQENFNELEQQHSDAPVYTNGHCVTDAQESLSGNSTDIELEIESQLAEMSVAEMLPKESATSKQPVTTLLELSHNYVPSTPTQPKKSMAGTKAMKLNKSPSTTANKPHTDYTINHSTLPNDNIDSEWTDDWGDNEEHCIDNTTLIQDTFFHSNPITATDNAKNAPLGQEFDVQSLKVEKRKDEFDFFADMEPVIDTTKSITMDVPQHEESVATTKALSFNVLPTTQDDESGWNDEDAGDWGWQDEET